MKADEHRPATDWRALFECGSCCCVQELEGVCSQPGGGSACGRCISGSGLFCFGLAWGINHGVLNREDYLPFVEKAWTGLTQSLSPEGKVLWGQPVESEPDRIARNSTSEFDTGAFLLAGNEIYELSGHSSLRAPAR
ncbi:MAG: glycoside hydrolase family 88 protein [Terriglobia bacterium]